MAKCMIPGNIENYDLDKSFEKNGYIDWAQGRNKYAVGDIVYLYIGGSIRRVMYQTKVEKVDMTLSESNHAKEFWKKPENFEKIKDNLFFRLRLLKKLDIEELSYDHLKENGLKHGAAQNKLYLSGNLEKYIEKYFNGVNIIPTEIENSAKLIKCYLDEYNLGNFEQVQYEEAINSFYNEFSPEKLETLEGIDLLNKIFIHDGDKNNLCYNLEYGDKYKIFGGIGGVPIYSSYFIYKEKNEGWKKGPSTKAVGIKEDEAILIGTKIRDAIVSGAKFIETAELETVEDYKKLESKLNEIFKDSNVNPTSLWIHKYYALIFPDKFPIWHIDHKSRETDGKKEILEKFNIYPEDGYYAKDGQLYQLSKEAGIKFYSLFNEEIMELFEEFSSNLKRNIIYFGAPGTGKSFKLDQDKVNKLKINERKYERVTFHPDYSYANFVGTYKPVPKKDDDGNKTDDITYEYVPGPFMRSLIKALKFPNIPFLLIIEEINRSNVAAVFGDVFQLLDRDENYESKFPIETTEDMRDYLKFKLGKDYKKIRIPSNMFIWATMNSADQGVFPMDTAFKRRWDFKYFGINQHYDKIEHIKVNLNGRKISWDDLRRAINDELLAYNINEDKLLGPFFAFNEYLEVSEFEQISEDKFEKTFKEIFKNKILMYLFEDAARAKRNDLFEGARDGDKNVIYSEIRDKFDEMDINVFCKNIRNKFSNENEYES